MPDEKSRNTVFTPDSSHPTSPHHKANGQFKTGNRASPGRPPKRVEELVLEAVNRAAPPEVIENAISEIFRLAKQYESWKAYQAGVTLALSYQVGRPLLRAEPERNDALETFLQRLRNVGQEDKE